MELINIKELEKTYDFMKSSKTLKTLTEQFKIIMQFNDTYCFVSENERSFKLYINVEKGRDDAISYKYILKSYNELYVSKIIDSEVLEFNRCQFKHSEPSVDDVFSRALELTVRKYTQHLD